MAQSLFTFPEPMEKTTLYSLLAIKELSLQSLKVKSKCQLVPGSAKVSVETNILILLAVSRVGGRHAPIGLLIESITTPGVGVDTTFILAEVSSAALNTNEVSGGQLNLPTPGFFTSMHS